MKKISFWKMSGSGNDFVVIDHRKKHLTGDLHAWARKLCHRQFGAGADGLLLLEPSTKGSFRMLYYNADGSRAAMCGNGARCMAWVANSQKIVGTRFDFLTDDGLVGAQVNGSVVQVTLSDARDFRVLPSVKAGGKSYRVAFLNTGVPHAVIRVPDVDRINLPLVGPELRFHRAFGPEGANVNFVQRLDAHRLKVRTYERGVEGETLACGTGVTAAAITGVLEGWVQGPVRCRVAGGDTLEVKAVIASAARQSPPERLMSPRSHRSLAMTSQSVVATQVRLKGPVRLTFKGEFYV